METKIKPGNKNKVYPSGVFVSSQVYYLPKESALAVRNSNNEEGYKGQNPDIYFKKIALEDIGYIKSDLDYIRIYTVDGKCHRVYTTLINLSAVITEGFLFQVHKSFIVNIVYASLNEYTRLADVEIKVIFGKTNITVPLGRRFIPRDDLLIMLGVTQILDGCEKMSDQLFFNREEKSLLVRNTKKHIFDVVYLKDVRFIQAGGDYIFIYTVDGKRFMILSTMKSIAETLKTEKFQRVNRSFIVNEEHTTNKHDRKINLKDATGMESNEKIPIGRVFRGNAGAIPLRKKVRKNKKIISQ